ncbi:MAG: serine/threonine protein kinase [Bradymonadaceae bacterium]|nr:serine/threonine protein kinase [Lujinxingiaceae bacterium]
MSSSREHRKQLYERLVGQTIAGRFEIVSLMGFGGMGAVYEAIQRNMNRRIALKFIPSHNPVTAARFEREALTVSQLRHPNTVTVFDYGQTDDGFLFLTMELLNGHTLSDLIKEGPISPERVVHIASQVCRSLSEAHRHGIVHRDIKPDNIFLIEVDGDKDVAKVLDFGIAKVVSGEDDVQLTGDGRIIGTPRYMSPEQILSEKVDNRSDIYSLGCIIFEMLCGAPPFQQPSTTALMISHTQDAPPPFAERLPENALGLIPLGLEHVVRRSLAKRPQDRPQTTDELREELEQALVNRKEMLTGANRAKLDRSVTIMAADADPVPTKSAPPIAAIAIGAVIVLIIVLATLVVLKSNQQGGEPNGALAAELHAAGELENGAAVAESDPMRIRISSEPSSAMVLDGLVPMGKTPLTVALPPNTTSVTYRLELEGFEAREVDITVNPQVTTRQEFSFALVAAKAAEIVDLQAIEARTESKNTGTSNKTIRPRPPQNTQTTTTKSPEVTPKEDTKPIIIERLEDEDSRKPQVERL